MKKMQWHRVLAFVMTLCMLLSMCPVSAFADEGGTAETANIAEGTDGSLSWVLDAQGKMTISGSGAMQNTGSYTWGDYKSQITELVVEEGVTEIGKLAFQNCTNLTKITLPGSMTWIRANVFNGCTGLTDVVIPEGVHTIGGSVFANCTNLKCLTLPGSITRLWESICDGCTSLVCVHYLGSNWDGITKGDPSTGAGLGETLENAYSAPQMTHHEAVASTCKVQGTRAYYECPGCGKLYGENTATATAVALEDLKQPLSEEHNFENGSCTECGAVESTDHAYNENGFCTHTGECDAPYQAAEEVEGVYQIGNAGQLYWFAAKVNAGESTISAKLTANITVNAKVLEEGELVSDTSALRTWTPVGSADQAYTGTFDGGEHTVSGLYFKDKKAENVGLFSCIGSDAQIKNLGVIDSYFGGKAYIGAVVGYASGAAVSGCWSGSFVEDLVTLDKHNDVAGVVGSASNVTLTNCHNTGTVKSLNTYTGGVVGQFNGTMTGCYNEGNVTGTAGVGGVVGYVARYEEGFTTEISECYNTGKVNGTERVGGLVGWLTYANVKSCYNSGTVTMTSTSAFINDAGGLVGSNASSATISDCYNTGDVTSNVRHVGGIVGNNGGTVSYCYNTGKVTGTASEDFECSGTLVGAVAGKNTGTITRCYYLTGSAVGGETSQNGVGIATAGSNKEDVANQTTGVTTEQLASGEIADELSGGRNLFPWRQTIGEDTQPNFTGKVVYGGYRGCQYVYDNTGSLNRWEPGEHTWTAATCSTPKTCSVCGATEGETLPHTFVDGLCKDCGAADENGKTVNIGTGADSETYTDDSGYYADADTSALNTNVATVTVTGTPGTSVRGESVTELTSGKTYLLVNTRANKALTTGEATWTSYSGLAFGDENTVENASMWTVASVDGGYTVRNLGGKYLTGGQNAASLGDTADVLTIEYVDGNWRISKDGYYLNDAGGQHTCAFFWQESGYEPSTDIGSQWAIYEVTTQGGTTNVQFHGVRAGKTQVTIGSTNYYITVAIGDDHVYENGFCLHTDCDAPYEVPTLNDDGVYEIDNAGKLYWFANYVNAKTQIAGADTEDTADDVYSNAAAAKLTADITINTKVLDADGDLVEDTTGLRTWTPIGIADIKYSGNFDGAKHTISGLYLNDTDSMMVGLFGKVDEGSVKNVTLSESYVKGDQDVGAIVGYGFDATVSNCHNTSVVRGYSSIGGVVGGNYDGLIENCTNSGAVYGEKYSIGGVVGNTYSNHEDNPNVVKNCSNTGTVTCTYEGTKSADIYVGGVVGQNGKGVVTNCTNTGTVTNNGKGGFTGGIIGYNDFQYGSPALVSDCNNSGTVTGKSSVGGIIGKARHKDNKNVAVTNCHNTGAISGTANVGGVIGYVDSAYVTNCSNSATVTSTGSAGALFGLLYGGGSKDYNRAKAEKCWNTGNVTGNTQVGGIAGNMQKSETTDCYTIGSVTGTNYVGGLVGKNSDKAYMTRCYHYGSVTGSTTSKYVGPIAGDDWKKGSYTSVYYLGEEETDSLSGTEFKTEAQFASGELTYLLNNSKANEDVTWRQTLPTDTYPKLDGKVVYYGYTSCDENEVAAYTNTPATDGEPGHDYVNGFCERTAGEIHYQEAPLVDDVYQISNGGQLYWFAALVNGGTTDANAILMNNITVNEGTMSAESTTARVWTPIGNSKKAYTGTFDGNGKTVSGLYYNSCGSKVGNDQYIGLIGQVGADGEVKNVTVTNSYFYAYQKTGGIAGTNSGTISGCTNEATVGCGTGNNVGGIAGQSSGKIENCTNSGTVIGVQNIGGIVGYVTSGSVTGCTNSGKVSYVGTYGSFTGGIVGSTYSTGIVIRDCVNTGDIEGKSTMGGVGGILGYSTAGSAGTVTVSHCYNTGNVSGDKCVGGIVGQTKQYVQLQIENCYNTGAVSTTRGSVAGGIFGYVEKSGSASVTNCYNVGTVYTKSWMAGGISGGYDDKIILTNCYYLTGCATDSMGGIQNGMGFNGNNKTTEDVSGKCEARTAAQFASGEVAYLLNGSTSEGDLIWFQNVDNDQTPDASPKFVGGTVYKVESVYTNNPEGHTCKFNREVATATYLKSAADCQNAAVYYKSCSCGQHGEETFTYGDVDSTNHTGTLGTEWKHSETSHWQEYSCCGAHGEETAHTGGNATCTEQAECSVCHVKYGNLADHVYDKEVATETYLKSAANCQSAAVYYKSCSCGEKGTDTFTHGEKDANVHTGELGAWQHDADKHWKEYDCCGAHAEEAAHKDEDGNYICDDCNYELPQPATSEVIRLAGDHRYDTAIKVANEMKEVLGVEKFNAIIVAYGSEYYDALAGSYLSAAKGAPILLSWGETGKYEYLDTNNIEYIKENLAEGGTVYLLGGEDVVPVRYEDELPDCTVTRLGGDNRFETNLMILNEVGVPAGSEILVCTATNFADCLSAAATGKPILLVWNERGSLYGGQENFLNGLNNCTFTIIGGDSAVSEKFEEILSDYGEVSRVAGDNRLDTSVEVAKHYFQNTDSAVLAWANNFPDGLCGGALAYAMKSPLILTNTQFANIAADYTGENGITTGVVLGSGAQIADTAVREIFTMAEDAEIISK